MTGKDEANNYDVEEIDNIDGEAPPIHPLAFDWAIYAHHLREADLSAAQQRQLIETLWTIATLFVDYGFGLHPVQQASEQACGEEADLAALIAEDMLCSGDNPTDKNNNEIGAAPLLPEGGTR